MEDAAIFCEECGTKYDANSQIKVQGNSAKKKTKLGWLVFIIAIALLVIAIVFMVRACSSPASLEDVASDFTEAVLIDFNAKKAVSLMSEKLIDSYKDKA